MAQDGQFGQGFEDFTRKTLDRSDKLIRAVGIATFSGVIRDTPVGDPDLWKSSPKDAKGRGKGPAGYVGGRLRGNWRCSLDKADTSTIEAPNTDAIKGSRGKRKAYKNFPDLGAVMESMKNTCQSATRKSVLWLANSLPYASVIEYDGHSKQAPQGMVRRNVARVKQNISRELSKLKGGS